MTIAKGSGLDPIFATGARSMRRAVLVLTIIATASVSPVRALGPPEPTRKPSLRVVDLDEGESTRVVLADGTTAEVALLSVKAEVDPVHAAVWSADVKIKVNGQAATLGMGNYHLPVMVGGVQVDCPAVLDMLKNSTLDHWGLEKAARLRLWPSGAPWIEPETFVFPARQRWLATMTQMSNEPVYVDGGEDPKKPKIYYHSGLDIGGAEGLVEVVAALDGIVVSTGTERLPGYTDSPVSPRYDVVYLLDDRGWYYRYSHLKTIDAAIRPGAIVKKGQRVGVLGKEGASGGWTHLHFEAKSRMPSGKWGTQDGYAFLWQAVLREQEPAVIAVARPHRFARVGDTVVLDGRRSWARSGHAVRHDWTFSDGTTSSKPVVDRVYEKPGTYSEILKVTGADGQVGYDFAVVQIVDPKQPGQIPPTIHAAYYPTTGVKPGAAVTFKVRTFRVGRDGGEETWDFGDGSPPATTRSDGNADRHNPDGYAIITHAFNRPGDYLVRVSRPDRQGLTATTRLHVRVE